MVTLLLFFSTWIAQAGGLIRENFQSVRGMGMGNAYIALADDSNCLWANPAGLAYIKKGHLNLFDSTIGFNNLDTLNSFKNMLLQGNSSNLVGTGQTYVRGSFKPTLFTPYFGLSIYEQANGFWEIQGLSLTNVDVYAVNDIGIIAGMGLPISPYFSIGVSGRFVQRSGVDAIITPQSLLAILGLNSTDFMSAIYQSLASMAGTGYGVGVNAGVLVKIPLKSGPTIQLAGTVEEIMDTVYRPIGTAPTPNKSLMNINAGAALVYDVGKTWKINFSGEFRHITESERLLKRLHFGMEFKNKYFALRGGLHQGYFTYGASFELLPHTKVHFASFSSELGDNPGERSASGYLVQAIIGFNPF